jgi:hypothetical protein
MKMLHISTLAALLATAGPRLADSLSASVTAPTARAQ